MAPKAKTAGKKKKSAVATDLKVKNAKDVKGGYKVGGITPMK